MKARIVNTHSNAIVKKYYADRGQATTLVYYLCIIALNQCFGMGEKRIKRYVNAVDDAQRGFYLDVYKFGYDDAKTTLLSKAQLHTIPLMRWPFACAKTPYRREEREARQELKDNLDECCTLAWCMAALAVHAAFGFSGVRVNRLRQTICKWLASTVEEIETDGIEVVTEHMNKAVFGIVGERVYLYDGGDGAAQAVRNSEQLMRQVATDIWKDTNAHLADVVAKNNGLKCLSNEWVNKQAAENLDVLNSGFKRMGAKM